MEIQLTMGYVAVVDPELYESLSVFRWHAHTSKCDVRAARVVSLEGYRKYRLIYMSRFIAFGLYENVFNGFIVDHANGDSLDNRISNLRITDKSGNMANSKIRSDNTGKFKGVKRTRYGTWQARIGDGGRIHIGTFHSEIEAAAAYNKAAIEMFGPMARLNDV